MRRAPSALRRSAALGILCSLLLSACGGHGGGANATIPSVSPTGGIASNTPSATTSFAWGADALKGATYVGPAKFQALGIDVDVQMHNEAGLVTYAEEASNPKSGLYRKFLTPQQIGQRFGADSATFNSVANYFAQRGLHVGGWPQHLSLFVSGTQAQLENALGTKFGVYQSQGTQFIAPTSAPHFPSTLAIRALRNVVDVTRFARDSVPVRVGNNLLSGYSPAQIRQVFDYNGAYRAGYTGKGIKIGIIGTGPMSPADVPTYGKIFNVNVAQVQQVVATDQGVASGLTLNSPSPNPSATPPGGFPFSTGLQSPPPVTPPCFGGFPNCNPEDGEAQIDTEQAASLAPDATVLFYIAYNPGECYQSGPGAGGPGNPCGPGPNAGGLAEPAIGIELADDEIEQAIADDTADVLSLSYGSPESYAQGFYFAPNDPTSGFGVAEFAALAAEGIAVFVSSGDTGAEGCARIQPLPPNANQPCVSFPAVDPNVVSVGGVTTPMNQFGQLTNQLTGWGIQTTAGNGGSGGGPSLYFAQPPWQQNIPGISGQNRNQPDASLEADASTGVAVLMDADPALYGSNMVAYGGTSVAAPEMAAMWALVLQACAQSSTCGQGGLYGYRLGNPAPVLYSFYGSQGVKNPQYSHVFYDVLYGFNGQAALQTGPTPVPSGAPLSPGFQAGPGYDLVTGLGVPFARALIQGVTGQ